MMSLSRLSAVCVSLMSVSQTEHERHLVPSNSTATPALLMWPVNRRSFFQLLNHVLRNYFKQHSDPMILVMIGFYPGYFSCSLASILRLSWNLCNRLQMDCCGFASTSIPQIGSLACEKNPNSAVESLQKNQAFWWIRVVGGSGTERVSPCVSCWGQKVGWANL
jgi:hypothetical protein